MSGHQFSFFLGPSDQLKFEAALRTSGDIAFLKDRSHSSQPEEKASSIIQELGREPFRILIARRADVPNISFRPIRGRNEFSRDVTVQPIVEFDRFLGNTRFIRPGRLYRVDKYWDADGKLASKPEGFIEWGERLYKGAKKSLLKVEQGCFAGEEALRMRKEGIAFEGLDIPSGSTGGSAGNSA
jgi:hypothetical protein